MKIHHENPPRCLVEKGCLHTAETLDGVRTPREKTVTVRNGRRSWGQFIIYSYIYIYSIYSIHIIYILYILYSIYSIYSNLYIPYILYILYILYISIPSYRYDSYDDKSWNMDIPQVVAEMTNGHPKGTQGPRHRISDMTPRYGLCSI